MLSLNVSTLAFVQPSSDGLKLKTSGTAPMIVCIIVEFVSEFVSLVIIVQFW